MPLPPHTPGDVSSSPLDGPLSGRGWRWGVFVLVQVLVWGGIAATALAFRGRRDAAEMNVSWLIIANFATAAVLTSCIAVSLHAWHWHARQLGWIVGAVCGAPLVAAFVHTMAAMASGPLLGDAWSFAGFAYASGTGVVRPAVLYLVWTLGYVAVAAMLDRHESQRHRARLEQLVRDGEVELLKAQFDPHFLFNTLTLLQAESDDPVRVEEVTQRLSQYLRAASHSGRELVPVGRQADECLAYLNLQRARFGPRLSWQIDVADAVAAAELPSLTVQTLVEHAVRHGMEQTGEPAAITILADEVPSGVRLEVRFPGSAAAEDATPGGEASGRPVSRHGLRNLRRRLELLCGPTARLEHSAASGVVTLAVESPKTAPHKPTTPKALPT